MIETYSCDGGRTHRKHVTCNHVATTSDNSRTRILRIIKCSSQVSVLPIDGKIYMYIVAIGIDCANKAASFLLKAYGALTEV